MSFCTATLRRMVDAPNHLDDDEANPISSVRVSGEDFQKECRVCPNNQRPTVNKGGVLTKNRVEHVACALNAAVINCCDGDASRLLAQAESNSCRPVVAARLSPPPKWNRLRVRLPETMEPFDDSRRLTISCGRNSYVLAERHPASFT